MKALLEIAEWAHLHRQKHSDYKSSVSDQSTAAGGLAWVSVSLPLPVRGREKDRPARWGTQFLTAESRLSWKATP